MPKKNKKGFKAIYKCWNDGCNAVMEKVGLEHFNGVYQFDCPFCGAKMKISELKGYKEYLEESKERNKREQEQ